ncbi:MAG: response regulator [Cyanobacteria bacterium]|nr:response regulator [Cyanobacteriota bacterium]
MSDGLSPTSYDSIPQNFGVGKRIMVIDEVAFNLSTIKKMLERFGFEVVTIASPKDSLRYMDGQEVFNAVFCCLSMQQLDGITLITLAKKLVEMRGGKLPPFVLMILPNEVSRSHEATLHGFSYVLNKPIELDRLLECLLTIADMAKLESS